MLEEGVGGGGGGGEGGEGEGNGDREPDGDAEEKRGGENACAGHGGHRCRAGGQDGVPGHRNTPGATSPTTTVRMTANRITSGRTRSRTPETKSRPGVPSALPTSPSPAGLHR